MKREFDLEKAKKNGCWTMGGQRAQILCDDFRMSKNSNYPVAARLFLEDRDMILFYTSDGKYFNDGLARVYDLTTVDPKAFDLQRAMDNNGMCKTRDGRDARIICNNRKGNFPIVALLGIDEKPDVFSKEGLCYPFEGPSKNDLVNL